MVQLSNSTAERFAAVTPSDSVDFESVPRAIYVGVGGDVVAVTDGGTAVTFKNAASGTVLPIQPSRINSTSTTATNLVALY